MGIAIADYLRKGSLRHRLRARRFARFQQLLARFDRPVRILDVGGTVEFWQAMDSGERDDLSVVLLNVFAAETTDPRFTCLAGDARDLSQFADAAFDVVFSNSVIEHVGGPSDQQAMADEVRRVGKAYFLQTPNYFFPIEPHVQFPLFQYLPVAVRIWLHMHFSLATYRKASSREEAAGWVDEIRLLSRRELAGLFPDAEIVAEKFFGLNKSYMAIRAAAPAPRGDRYQAFTPPSRETAR